ncbi:MAG: MYXO-CTERM sorting domain-containing protein [Byssovorax sp.]
MRRVASFCSFPRFSRSLLACAITLLVPAAAEAQVLRFSTTAPGRIIGTGNTLGLSKEQGLNGPGIKDSIGTFLSLDPASADLLPANAANPWPLGTTNDWTKNGSTAKLVLPSEGEVLYAELTWGGSYKYGDEDVTGSLGQAVTLAVNGMTMAIAPDPLTELTIAQQSTKGFAVNYYMRSANVTDFVKSQGAGTYSVSGVPATQTELINSLNAAGWTLTVALRDTSEPVRNLSVFVGGSFVDEDSQQDYEVSGFCTPPAGEVKGSVVISAIEGDANLVGDQLLIAPTVNDSFVHLSGPNNPENNFFCSQINDAKGNLDSQGSFGNQNQDALGGANIAGGRQGWDVTTVGLSSMAGQLQNGEKSAVLRTITTGDSYVPILAAFAIDVNAPDFTGSGSSVMTSASKVTIGDKLTVTAVLENTGQVPAEKVSFKMPLEAGLSLGSFKMDGQEGDINGQPVVTGNLVSGVDAGTLGAGKHRTVQIEVEVTGPPAGQKYVLEPDWGYAFTVCVGGMQQEESFSQFALVAYEAPPATTSSSSGSTTTTTSGGTGGEGGGTTSTGTGDIGQPAADSGCGCTVPAGGEGSWAIGAMGVAAALGAVRSRRRRALGSGAKVRKAARSR